MYRELFHIGDLPIFGYGMMVLLGALSGLWLLRREADQRGWDSQRAVDIGMIMIFLGLLGARLFYVITFYDEQFRGNLMSVFKIWEGGLVLYGGIIVGAIVLVPLARRARIPILPYLDTIAPSVAIGIAFGRIGCFLNGCCWGRSCSESLPFAVVFPFGSPAADQALRFGVDPTAYFVHPTQLYSSLNAFVLCWMLFLVQRRTRQRPGATVGAFFVWYGTFRFLVEMIRGDHEKPPGTLTDAQKICPFIVVIGVILVARALRRRPEMSPETLKAEPARSE